MPRLLAAVLLAVAALVPAACGGGGGSGDGAAARSSAAPTGPAADGEATPATGAAGRAAPDPAADPAVHVRALARVARAHDGTRAAGTPGARASEDYVAAALRAAGYAVHRQVVPFPFFAERRPPRVTAGGVRVAVRTMAYSPGGRVRGPVTEVGLGCAARDFANLAAGAVALARRGLCPVRVMARRAQAAGAAAVLVADRGREPVSATLGAPGLRIPALAVGAPGARALRRAGRASVRVEAESARRVTHNVIGERPGGQRTVMLGAHLDSVPAGPGINDNASGTAAVLAAAERLAATGATGLRVAFWGAEELGLYGSRRYVASLSPAARGQLVAYLNFDMVGTPGGRAEVYDTNNAAERALRGALRATGLRFGQERIGAVSDHAAFARAGIPVGGIFTGLDRCYHRACDDGGNVDIALLRTVTRAIATAARRLHEAS